jgi:DNA polymerase III subunit delta
MFYVFHGEDEFRRAEELARYRAAVMEAGLGELNIAVYDGSNLSVNELINASSTLPFFSERRLIIVTDMLQQHEKKATGRQAEEARQLIDYLPSVPDTTRLVFVESVMLKASALLKALSAMPNGHVKAFPRLNPHRGDDAANLRRWVTARATAKGVSIDRGAVELLIQNVGNDLRQIDQELEKLAGHVAYEREICASDVRALVSGNPETTIFNLIDALGMKRRQQALQYLHALVAQSPEFGDGLYPLYMIVRQIGQMLSLKDLAQNQRLPAEALRKELGVRDFQLSKLTEQSALFTTDELLHLLDRALEVDKGIKTGTLDPMLSLELLLVDATRRSSPTGGAQRERNRSRTR